MLESERAIAAREADAERAVAALTAEVQMLRTAAAAAADSRALGGIGGEEAEAPAANGRYVKAAMARAIDLFLE